MKKYVLLSCGFVKPTPEIMNTWNAWFASIKESIVDMAGFGAGREVSKAGTIDLPLGAETITGLVIVQAASFDDAVEMARRNPCVTSTRVYEMRSS
ncbi:MAG: hypothetical protein U1E21_20425 [Reyranellaceae bacterium]